MLPAPDGEDRITISYTRVVLEPTILPNSAHVTLTKGVITIT